MSQVSAVNAERALANRAHVRILLRLRQPAFAAALASAEQDVFTDRRGVAGRHAHAPLPRPGLVLGSQPIGSITAPRSRNSRSALTTTVCMTECPHRERVVPGRR